MQEVPVSESVTFVFSIVTKLKLWQKKDISCDKTEATESEIRQNYTNARFCKYSVSNTPSLKNAYVSPMIMKSTATVWWVHPHSQHRGDVWKRSLWISALSSGLSSSLFLFPAFTWVLYAARRRKNEYERMHRLSHCSREECPVSTRHGPTHTQNEQCTM